jgi:transposase
MPARPHLTNPLRELIVAWSVRDKKTPAVIAHLLRCDVSTVYSVLRRFKHTGNAHALRRGRACYVLNEHDVRWLLSVLRANPAVFLDEIQVRLRTDRHVWVSIATISRTLARYGWSHKKLSKQAAERNAFLRAVWLAEYGHLPASCFVWMDESGVDDRDHFRNWGWSPYGEAPVRSDPFTRDGRLTMIPALTFEGIIAMDIFDGGVGKEQFLRFLTQQVVRTIFLQHIHPLILVQIPLLNPFRPENPLPRSVVVLDNCSIHHDEDVRALIEGMAGKYLHLCCCIDIHIL